mmetsp:Transcript_122988/g.229794  ORF Transcript_122988/g.229794 Transcript_122988/m.229794 type:complete len:114 (+) Transcript_122988:2731-3072(+)
MQASNESRPRLSKMGPLAGSPCSATRALHSLSSAEERMDVPCSLSIADWSAEAIWAECMLMWGRVRHWHSPSVLSFAIWQLPLGCRPLAAALLAAGLLVGGFGLPADVTEGGG